MCYATTKIIHDTDKAEQMGREDAAAGRPFNMDNLPCDCPMCLAAYVDGYNKEYQARML